MFETVRKPCFQSSESARWWQISLAILLAASILSCGSRPVDPSTRFSLAELTEDFHQLRRLIYDRHPMTFTDRDVLRQAFTDQQSLLRDSMTVLEFYRVIAPAASAVRCAHTELYLPDSIEGYLRDSGHYFPIDVRLPGDTLFALRDLGQESRLTPGDRITAINRTPITGLLAHIRSCLPADGTNEAKKDFLLNRDFAKYFAMFIEDTGSFAISYVNASDTVVRTDTVDAVPWSMIRENKPGEKTIATRIEADSGFAALRIQFFDFYDDADYFPDLMDSFFTALADEDIHSLVLDIRGNEGGLAYGAATLLGYLLSEPFRYFASSSTFLLDDLKRPQPVFDNRFDGNLYVLIDGGCYSTTGHFCAILKHHEIGTFIGGKTGGSYACNGGYKEPTLSHTGIKLLLSHAVFVAEAPSLPPGNAIAPDIPVETSIAGILKNYDPLMVMAVALIDSAKAPS